jgi:hypothetical protein
LLAVVVVAAACTGGARSPSGGGIADPPRSIAAKPDYTQACTPAGLDNSETCLRVTLAAIDNARSVERLKPMEVPSDFARLSVPAQLLVVIDRERVDRGLSPFAGISGALAALAKRGADAADLPPDPGAPYTDSDTEWIGAFANALDVDYQWVYDDGVGSGLPECGAGKTSGCWADRNIVLDSFGSGALAMGAAVNTTADRGGPSLAATFAAAPTRPSDLSYTWDQALASSTLGTLRPLAAPPANESATHIRDPARTVPADPDFSQRCNDGLDSSAACVHGALAAVNHARALEGVKPMVLPPDFDSLSVPEHVLVAINLERVDRGLPPFAGLTGPLNRVAQRGADTADDPPDPGDAYDVTDGEWAGGSSNGLDAVYGWMYDDGIGSGNLDCPPKGGPGCWGHRHGILDDFGSVGTLVMGAAVNPTADINQGDKGGTSIAAELAVTRSPGPLLYRWNPVGG